MNSQDFSIRPKYRVLNPLGEKKKVSQTPLVERLSSLAGKTIYCVSQVILGSEDFIARVAQTLPDFLPDTRIVSLIKPSAYMTDDPDFWNEIVEKADAVIYGCGV